MVGLNHIVELDPRAQEHPAILHPGFVFQASGQKASLGLDLAQALQKLSLGKQVADQVAGSALNVDVMLLALFFMKALEVTDDFHVEGLQGQVDRQSDFSFSEVLVAQQFLGHRNHYVLVVYSDQLQFRQVLLVA